jgi:cytochrome c553
MTVREEISAILVAMVALLTLSSPLACATEEKADLLTQTALNLDAHPDTGKVQFERACSGCHGPSGQGEDGRHIPALAGQRFAYLVRQMANNGLKNRFEPVLNTGDRIPAYTLP